MYGGGNASYFIDKFNNENTMIIAKDGVSENCIRWVEDKFFVNHHAWTVNLQNNDNLIKYIYYYLLAHQNTVYSLAEGSAQKGINQKSFLALEIPLPPLNVQQDIVFMCEHYDIMNQALTKEIQLLESNDVINILLESVKINDVNSEIKVITTDIDEVIITVGNDEKPKKKLVNKAIEM